MPEANEAQSSQWLCYLRRVWPGYFLKQARCPSLLQFLPKLGKLTLQPGLVRTVEAWVQDGGQGEANVKAECGDPLCKEQRLLLLDLVEDRWYFPCMLMALICLVLGCICVHVYVWVCVPACIRAYV